MLWSGGRHTTQYVCPLWFYLTRAGEELRLSRFLREWEQSPARRFDVLYSYLSLCQPDCTPSIAGSLPQSLQGNSGYIRGSTLLLIALTSIVSLFVDLSLAQRQYQKLQQAHHVWASTISVQKKSSQHYRQSASSKYLPIQDVGGQVRELKRQQYSPRREASATKVDTENLPDLYINYHSNYIHCPTIAHDQSGVRCWNCYRRANCTRGSMIEGLWARGRHASYWWNIKGGKAQNEQTHLAVWNGGSRTQYKVLHTSFKNVDLWGFAIRG